MKLFKAKPYALYGRSDGSVVHLETESLALTEVTKDHAEVLRSFDSPRIMDPSLLKEEERQRIDELLDLDLIVPADQTLEQYKTDVSLHPKVRAFRIVLTEQCNLRCKECFVTKNQSVLKTMSRETLDKVIRQTLAFGKEYGVKYHFFGGEPLLKFDYIKHAVGIVEEAQARGEVKKPLYAITTNLTLLNDEIIDFFKKYDFKVGVSIDGPESVNDQLRAYANGEGSFKDVEANYARLVQAGVDVHVLITPHQDFLDRLPEIVRFVLETFPMSTLTINTPLHFETLAWIVPGPAYAKVLVEITRMAKERGVTIDSAASPPLAALAGNIRREGPCAVYCDNIMTSVSTDGRMSFCSQKWHLGLSVSSIDRQNELRIPIKRSTDCVTCEARHICGGPCPANQIITRREMDDNKCGFMKALIHEVVENLDLFEEPAQQS